jgi:two-component system NarL family sensor kinase
MTLRTKIVALAVAPLLVALVLVALAVRHQERDLAQRERALIEQTYMNPRRAAQLCGAGDQRGAAAL